VDQLHVDVEDRLFAFFRMDNVVVPNLLEHGPRLGGAGHVFLFSLDIFARLWRLADEHRSSLLGSFQNSSDDVRRLNRKRTRNFRGKVLDTVFPLSTNALLYRSTFQGGSPPKGGSRRRRSRHGASFASLFSI
jgi:hypothetical protein